MEVSGWATRTALFALVLGMLMGAAALGAAIGSHQGSPHAGAYCPIRPHVQQSAVPAGDDSASGALLEGASVEVVQLASFFTLVR